MKKGKLSAVLGAAQIVCVGLMFIASLGVLLDMLLVILMALLIVFAVIMSAISLWKNEKPMAWAIGGLVISMFWGVWVLIAPILRAF